MAQRLQKYLARAGLSSRRKAELWITEGRVYVNGQLANLGMQVQDGDEVELDGVRISQPKVSITYMLNKPAGYLSTVSDDRGRPTVMELVPKVPGLHPVGRLDLDSEGLLLLTTDGELTQQLTHPRYEHEKTYRVWCREGTLKAGELAVLEQGVELDDGMARAVVAKVAEGGCSLVLHDGRKRQVRRMLAAVGHHVTRLQRSKIGKLELAELAVGAYRVLEADELKLVRTKD